MRQLRHSSLPVQYFRQAADRRACQGTSGSVINLDPIDLIWAAPEIVLPAANSKGNYRGGQKGSIVAAEVLVEKECAMLAKMRYMGAKMFRSLFRSKSCL